MFVIPLVLGAMVFASAESPSAKNDVRKLQSERLALLEDIVDRYRYGQEQGKPVFEELLAAERQLLDANLELSASSAERHKILKSLVSNREKLVSVRTAGARVGTYAEIEIMHARVSLLEAKIQLSQETLEPDGK